LTNYVGCSSLRPVIIHPIEKSDIFSIEKNSKITKPDNSTIIVEKDGWFLSDNYVKEVMQARINK